MVLIHALVLVAIGGVLYGYTKSWVAQKELEMKTQQIVELQSQIEQLKK